MKHQIVLSNKDATEFDVFLKRSNISTPEQLRIRLRKHFGKQNVRFFSDGRVFLKDARDISRRYYWYIDAGFKDPAKDQHWRSTQYNYVRLRQLRTNNLNRYAGSVGDIIEFPELDKIQVVQQSLPTGAKRHLVLINKTTNDTTKPSWLAVNMIRTAKTTSGEALEDLPNDYARLTALCGKTVRVKEEIPAEYERLIIGRDLITKRVLYWHNVIKRGTGIKTFEFI